MKIVITSTKLDLEGKWFCFRVTDSINVDLKIRPLFLDISDYIKDVHTTVFFKKGRKRKEKCDFMEFSLSLVDYVLEDFRGFGSTPDKPLEITADNKRKIAHVDGLLDFVMSTSKKLAKERIKNALLFERENRQG